MREGLREIAREYQVPFERVLLEYIREEVLSVLFERGFGDCLWLRRPRTIGTNSFTGFEDRRLSFLYRESERILPRDGFVPGCAYGEDFLNQLVSHVLFNMKNIRIRSFKVQGHILDLDLEWERMYVPMELEILPHHREGITPTQSKVELPILHKSYMACSYPTEYEVADHMGEILSHLELLGEMEHYLYTYEIFTKEAVEGTRLQSAVTSVLEKKGIRFTDENMQIVLHYRDYSYMKKKWKILLRRQHLLSPDWEKVIDKLSQALLPVWETSKRGEIFFGDWMPEIGRYLD